MWQALLRPRRFREASLFGKIGIAIVYLLVGYLVLILLVGLFA